MGDVLIYLILRNWEIIEIEPAHTNSFLIVYARLLIITVSSNPSQFAYTQNRDVKAQTNYKAANPTRLLYMNVYSSQEVL